MAGNLTQWEKDQIKTIDNLIQKCKLRYCAFEREHLRLNKAAPEDVETLKKGLKESVAERLRYFAIDLFSALDYLCYLCHCHFKNKGDPSNSGEARTVNFPYKNLQKSDDVPQKTICKGQKESFVWENFKRIFGIGQHASAPERYARFRQMILNCQVKTKIGADEKPLQQQEPMKDAAKYFNTLHFLRNSTAHRNLVDMKVKNGWLYVNLRNKSREFVPERIPDRDNDPDQWQSIKFSLGCWVTVPFISTPEPLLTVTPNLLRFVINTRDELLEIAYGPDGDIAKFDDDEVRHGLDDGVYIGRHYLWAEFDEKCDVMRTSDLWAV